MKYPFFTEDGREAFCKICDCYKPKSQFYDSALKLKRKICKECEKKRITESRRRRRARVEARLLQQLRRRYKAKHPDHVGTLDEEDIKAILEAWEYSSVFGSTINLTLDVLDPTKGLHKFNVVPVTRVEVKKGFIQAEKDKEEIKSRIEETMKRY
jgi:hypothetical protein